MTRRENFGCPSVRALEGVEHGDAGFTGRTAALDVDGNSAATTSNLVARSTTALSRRSGNKREAAKSRCGNRGPSDGKFWSVRLGLLAVFAVLFALSPAPADAAYVPYPPADTFTFHRAPCPDEELPDETAGCALNTSTFTSDGTLWHFDIWAPNRGWAADDRAVRLHELGHVFDSVLLDDTERQAFMDIMGYGDYHWETERVRNLGTDDFPSMPDELFADAYAYAGLSGRYRSRLGYRFKNGRLCCTAYEFSPTREQLRAAVRLIRGAA